MGAKKEAKQVASKTGPAAQAETGVTDTITVANGQEVRSGAPQAEVGPECALDDKLVWLAKSCALSSSET